jgi:hypothetical protein
MSGVPYQYLSSDHDRLDRLLELATAKPRIIGMKFYADFRKRLLRHSVIEKKIVLPAIARSQGGRKSALAERLHLDDGAIVSVMVPPPNPSIILKSVIRSPQPTGENDGGLYELFERDG